MMSYVSQRGHSKICTERVEDGGWSLVRVGVSPNDIEFFTYSGLGVFPELFCNDLFRGLGVFPELFCNDLFRYILKRVMKGLFGTFLCELYCKPSMRFCLSISLLAMALLRDLTIIWLME